VESIENTKKNEDMLRYARKNQSALYLLRQEVAFRGKCRKIKGCGSLKENFYTKFKPVLRDFGAVTWWKKR